VVVPWNEFQSCHSCGHWAMMGRGPPPQLRRNNSPGVGECQVELERFVLYMSSDAKEEHFQSEERWGQR
jgi:hypothetical protein